MRTDGRHLLVEYTGCDPSVLEDKDRIAELMIAAATAAQTTVVASVFREFAPQGVTGIVVIEESHLSIHTWPEYCYAAVDFFTCGSGLPDLAHKVLFSGLGAGCAESLLVDRGVGTDHGLVVRSHWIERPSGSTATEPKSVGGSQDCFLPPE